MRELYNMIVKGVCGIGMVNGLYSIYHTNPPYKAPNPLDISNAQLIDAQALHQDCQRVLDDIGVACTKEAERLNG